MLTVGFMSADILNGCCCVSNEGDEERRERKPGANLELQEPGPPRIIGTGRQMAVEEDQRSTGTTEARVVAAPVIFG